MSGHREVAPDSYTGYMLEHIGAQARPVRCRWCHQFVEVQETQSWTCPAQLDRFSSLTNAAQRMLHVFMKRARVYSAVRNGSR
jgi:hypothetical protein